MRFPLVYLFALLLFAACNTEPSQEAPKAISASTHFTIDEQVAEYLQYDNLQLFPIRAQAPFLQANKGLPDFQSLAQALDTKEVEIREKDAAPQQENAQIAQEGAVNTLYARNSSNKAVYLMAGEVVLGGRQDRVLAHDIVLPPNSEWRPIEVYCVEHGRWEYKQKTPQNFSKYAFAASNNVRYAVVHEKQQGRVWDEVGNVTTMNFAESKTGTYGALQENKQYQKKLQGYLEFFQNKLQNDSEVVGVIAATGDKVIACDIFGSNALFQQQYPQLLHAYIADASTFGTPVNQEQKAVEQFFGAAMHEYEHRRPRNNDRIKALWKGQLLHFTWLQNNSSGKVTREVPTYRDNMHSIYTNQL